MKIAIITSDWNPPQFAGGISRVVFELRKVWIAQGHTVHVYAKDTVQNEAEGIFKISVPGVPLNELLFSLILSRIKRLGAYDVIFPQSAMMCFFLKKYNCVPFLHTLSNVEQKILWRFWRYSHEFFEKKALKGIKRCFVLSKDTQTQLEKVYKLPAQNILKINNGVDYNIFKPLSVSGPAKFTLFSAGRFIPRKRFDLLIKAFSIFVKKHSDTLLLIAGSGVLENQLKALVTRLGITSMVKFVGNLDENSILELYRSSSLFVLPSLTEGMPMVVLEAQSCGLPVIIGSFQSAKEVIAENKTGLIVDSTNPEDWAYKIEELYANRKLLSDFGKAARERIIKDFSWDLVARKIREGFNLPKHI